MDNSIVPGIIIGVGTGVLLGVITAIYKAVRKKSVLVLATFLPALVIGIVVGFGYFLFDSYRGQPCVPLSRVATFAISSPAVGSNQPRMASVSGTACSVPANNELWLFVIPDGLTSYYPQQQVLVSSNGGWSSSVILGVEGNTDVGHGFTIIAVYVEPSAKHFITEFFQQTGVNGYVGIEPFPTGMSRLADVHVIRQ